MRILLSGSTGLLGRALASRLEERGDEVWRLDRQPRGWRSLGWCSSSEELAARLPAGLDAVVQLAGSPLAVWPWNAATRRRILDSRVHSTQLLAEALARTASLEAGGPPPHFLSASAIGLYRPGWPAVDESEPADPRRFLGQVCRDWEAATQAAGQAGLPVAWLRTGLVLDPAGGLLGRLLPLWRRGLGARLGPPELPWSWIHVEDWCAAVLWLLEHRLDGPFNLCAPNPVPQQSALDLLSRLTGRRALPAPPTWLLALLGGAMAREILLSASAATPGRLLLSGFTFRHESLEQALAHLLSRP